MGVCERGSGAGFGWPRFYFSSCQFYWRLPLSDPKPRLGIEETIESLLREAVSDNKPRREYIRRLLRASHRVAASMLRYDAEELLQGVFDRDRRELDAYIRGVSADDRVQTPQQFLDRLPQFSTFTPESLKQMAWQGRTRPPWADRGDELVAEELAAAERRMQENVRALTVELTVQGLTMQWDWNAKRRVLTLMPWLPTPEGMRRLGAPPLFRPFRLRVYMPKPMCIEDNFLKALPCTWCEFVPPPQLRGSLVAECYWRQPEPLGSWRLEPAVRDMPALCPRESGESYCGPRMSIRYVGAGFSQPTRSIYRPTLEESIWLVCQYVCKLCEVAPVPEIREAIATTAPYRYLVSNLTAAWCSAPPVEHIRQHWVS